MQRVRGAIVASTIFVFVAALSSEVACRDIPAAACDATTIVDQSLPDDRRDECATCVADHCCDVVGKCGQKEECTVAVEHTHACVVSSGPNAARAEEGCAGPLRNVPDERLSVYTCMRESCGHECGLPVCNVDPAAIEIITPTCDGCVTGACCNELNACYGNRTCKLQIECIAKNCAREFSNLLSAAPIPGIQRFVEASCSGPDVFVPETDPNLSCIVEKCFKVYPPSGFVADPSKSAACLSGRFFSCAATASCGSSCQIQKDAAAE
jgi:hypothetical protein